MIYASKPGRFELHCGDVLDCIPEVAPGSVQTIVTSPPYFNLRDYGTAEWEGGDPLCGHGVAVRTGRPKEASSTITSTQKQEEAGARFRAVCGLCGALRVDQQVGIETNAEQYADRLVEIFQACRSLLTDDGTLWLNLGDTYGGPDVKQKDLAGAPWRVAFGLRDAGWFLRAAVIWDKTNAFPESAKDRPTESHEYVFLLSRASRYYFRHAGDGRHVRSVWSGPTSRYRGDHTAVMPLWLAQRCTSLTSRAGDLVLDPFAGTGTTLVAALGFARRAVGIDLLEENCEQAARRIRETKAPRLSRGPKRVRV